MISAWRFIVGGMKVISKNNSISNTMHLHREALGVSHANTLFRLLFRDLLVAETGISSSESSSTLMALLADVPTPTFCRELEDDISRRCRQGPPLVPESLTW